MEIKIPDFLKESENEITQRMLNNAPSDINVIQGDFFWDAIKPTSIEIYNLKNIVMQNFLKLFFLQTTSDVYLDLLASEYNLTRKSAIPAIQVIRFTGKAGTNINTDVRVSTKSTSEEESVIFKVIQSGSIAANGYIDLLAKCEIGGTIGNILPGNITLLLTSLSGMKSVTNISISQNGIDKEDDEDFRKRVIAYTQQPTVSGNPADYKKWCNSFEGVGDTKVFPLWNGKGSVKCVIMSDTSTAVTSTLINNVHDYIETVRPVCANVTIASAIEKEITISATVTHNTSVELDDIKSQFNTKIVEYLQSIGFTQTIVSIAKIGSLLLECDGVTDYSNLKLNDSTTNCSLNDEEIPILNSISLS